jgi:hypothetical protein
MYYVDDISNFIVLLLFIEIIFLQMEKLKLERIDRLK